VSRLRVRRLHPRAVLPRAQRDGDAGLDLVLVEELTLAPGARGIGRTGLAVELAPGTCGLVLPRSGRALRQGLTLANAPGLIDAGYRGELLVALINLGEEAVALEIGARVAQLVVLRLEPVELEEVEELSESSRGHGGFGHTGW
jgi:dUTP pyrophosphatase